MSQLGELLPLLVFFVAYKTHDIYVAIIALMVAMTALMIYNKLRGKSPTQMQILSLVLVIVLGGTTVFFRNELFLKWKPTLLNWLFALVFIGSHFIGKKVTVVERLMSESKIELSKRAWSHLNISWVVFFVFLGGLNLFVAYQFDTNTWVNFKVFGILGLSLLFVIGQAIYIGRFHK